MLTEPIKLTAVEARVIGALVEKEVTTPDYYPLTMNALINACNQRSNRDPVMDLDEDGVRPALEDLEDKHLAGRARSADGRVTKYEHWLGEVFNFSRSETALICMLLLRGPQTPGELRGRTERLHPFAEMSDVVSGLQKLMNREPALVAVLPRQPGARECRYAHLLCGSENLVPPSIMSNPVETNPLIAAEQEDRITRLESSVAVLERELRLLREKIDSLFS